jgi:phage-related protein
VNELDLQESARLEIIAARNTIAMGEFKDREKAFKSLTPSLQELKRTQAKKKMSVAYAKRFAELFRQGKVPDWVLDICDFETIQLLTE